MINVKNPNQLDIFDPWDFLTPKRRNMLDNSWPGLFRKHILPSIPVHKVAKYFNESFGRPTKELYDMIGALVLGIQQYSRRSKKWLRGSQDLPIATRLD